MERRFSAPSSDDAIAPDFRIAATSEVDRPVAPADLQKTLVIEEPDLDRSVPPPSPPASEPNVPKPASPAPRVMKLQPTRRKRFLLKHALPAWSVSLLVHLAIFTALAATLTGGVPESRPIDFDTALGGGDRTIEELPIQDDPGAERAERLEERFELAASRTEADVLDSDERPDIGSVVMGGFVSPSSTPSIRSTAGRGGEGTDRLALEGLRGRTLSTFSQIPTALGSDLSLDGRTLGDPTWSVSEVGEALNQLAYEILRHLQDHKLTVVWLFDESASMRDDQLAVIEKFDRVTNELAEFADPDKKASGALTHAVIGFGEKLDVVLEKPTTDVETVRAAIKRLKVDSSGVENTMQAIRGTVSAFSNLIARDKERRLILVLVTDEAGDDGEYIDEALDVLTKTKTALYVLGRQAVFGYPFARHRYVDPITKDVYHPTIRRGPESADIECFQWDGLYTRWDEQPSGFGAWELARLAKESGGIYFLLPSEEFMRIRNREKTYTTEVLKEYMPEYVSRSVYAQRRAESDLRRSLHILVEGTRTVQYRREFPIEAEGLRAAAMEELPKMAERLEYLKEVQRRLDTLKKHREREPERRWRAHYDLMLAQTIAFQVKAYEYQALMHRLVAKPQEPTKRSTADLAVLFVVDHSTQAQAPESETAKKYADAQRLLNDVVAEYPDTPWADLARDTLARGFSVILNQHERSPQYNARSQFVPKY